MSGIAAVWERIYFTVSLITMEGVFCSSRPKRNFWWFRWLLSSICLTGLASVISVNTAWENQMLLGSVIIANIFSRTLLSLLTVLLMHLCFELDIWNALFLLTVSLSCQRMQYSFYKITEFLAGEKLNLSLNDSQTVCLGVGSLIVFAAVFYCFFRSIWEQSYFRKENRFLVGLTLVIVETTDLFHMFVLASDPYANFGSVMFVQRFQEILTQMLLLTMLYNLIGRRMLMMEQETIASIMRQRSSQYIFSQELIQSINIKNHDLKKQIRYLRDHALANTELITSLEDMTSDYDTLFYTENATLNIVLSEKSIICRQRGIPFTCVADGRNMDFIKDLDLYTLFANLLDNAIEASCAEGLAQRNIHLVIRQQAGFLSIHEENYYVGSLFMQDGLPVTTKEDYQCHGYGMRSIRQTVEQYDGTMSIKTDNGIFEINILLPLP